MTLIFSCRVVFLSLAVLIFLYQVSTAITEADDTAIWFDYERNLSILSNEPPYELLGQYFEKHIDPHARFQRVATYLALLEYVHYNSYGRLHTASEMKKDYMPIVHNWLSEDYYNMDFISISFQDDYYDGLNLLLARDYVYLLLILPDKGVFYIVAFGGLLRDDIPLCSNNVSLVFNEGLYHIADLMLISDFDGKRHLQLLPIEIHWKCSPGCQIHGNIG